MKHFVVYTTLTNVFQDIFCKGITTKVLELTIVNYGTMEGFCLAFYIFITVAVIIVYYYHATYKSCLNAI